MKKEKNRKGSSLVTVVAAFSLLLIAVAAAYTCVLVAENLLKKTEDTRAAVETAFYEYYAKTLVTPEDPKNTPIYAKIDGAVVFSFNIKIIEGKTTEESDISVYYFE